MIYRTTSHANVLYMDENLRYRSRATGLPIPIRTSSHAHAWLRTTVRAVNENLSALRLEMRPDKTFIGKIQGGFDFLGYRFGAPVLKLAQATIEKFVEQATQLYEQGRRERSNALLLGKYVRRWLGWATGGLANLPGGDFDPKRSTIANDWLMPLLGPHARAASLV
jgi:hypothetical protein